MTRKTRINGIVARLACAALLAQLPPPALATGVPAGAVLQGYVMGLDGRGAAGFRVHLIDAQGRDAAQAATDGAGVYRFAELAPGAYSLGIESPDGTLAPVAAAPLRLQPGELARRDVKLVEASAQELERVGLENRSFGLFWAGLSPLAKAGSILGVFVVLALTLSALDDESAGSVTDPD